MARTTFAADTPADCISGISPPETFIEKKVFPNGTVNPKREQCQVKRDSGNGLRPPIISFSLCNIFPSPEKTGKF
jgi:hypothetical protein